MTAASRKASSLSRIDTSKQLYALINGVTGQVDNDVGIATLPSLGALLKLDKLGYQDEFHYAVQAGDLSDMVVIR